MSTTTAIARGQGLRYVPALDGIRAIAVLAVMFFHFGQGWIPGGYLGVDVFFVLSGFLITTLLVEHAPKPFSARVFWARRARRLFPALALMLVIVLIYASVTPPLEQATIRGQGIATVFYVNNWWLLITGSEYFQAFQQASPLLHTWTLSVEEQWYVLLPLLLFVLVGLRRFRWRVILGLLSVLGVLSVAWTIVLAVKGASADRLYLGTDTRAQQLLLGGALAVLGARAVACGHERMYFAGRFGGRAGAVGLSAIVAMYSFWPEGEYVAVQLPVVAVAAAMLIVGVLTPGSWVSRVLATEPLRRVGLISYGLYLWHWPISVMLGDDATNAVTPMRLILTFVIAAASYRWLEMPVRRGRLGLRWLLALPLVLVPLAFLTTPEAGKAAYAHALPDHEAPPYSGSGRSTFFVGDSISGSMWLPAAGSPRTDIAVTGSFLLGCPLFDLRFAAERTASPPAVADVDCPAWEQQWRFDMARMNPDIGVLVGTSSWQFDVLDDEGVRQSFGSDGYQAVITSALDRALGDFTADRIAITSVPCTALPSNVINDQKNDRARTLLLNQLLRDYAERHGYVFIDTGAVTCAPDVSELYIDGLHFDPGKIAGVWDDLRPKLLAVR